MEHQVIITEIYASVQGESSYAGLPCTFIRLTGCPLRCRWCDTAYGFTGGDSWTLEQILEKVKSFGISLVELTGGEPLAQRSCVHLAERLLHEGFRVLIETGGSEDVSTLPQGVHIIMDIKCPGSSMHEKNRLENLKFLKPSDEIKFVLAHRQDYDWAQTVIASHQLDRRFNILFSPAFGLLAPKDLAAWMVEDRVSARLNLQQHKFIWHPKTKGV